MKHILSALLISLFMAGTIMACPNAVVVHRVVSTPYVEPVYSAVSTVTAVNIRVDVPLYSAYAVPAITVPYVQPPLPAPIVVPQPAAVPATPCPAPAMPAQLPAAASEDFCKLVLARLDKIDGRMTAFEGRLNGQPPGTSPPKPEGVVPPPPKASALTTTCASCHGTKPYTDMAGKLAPQFFYQDGSPRMTDTQIRKAVRLVKGQKMPPPDSPAGKAATPDVLNACLDELDDLAAVEGKATP